MNMRQAQAKEEFVRRIAEVRVPEFLRQNGCGSLVPGLEIPEDLKVSILQNDGTGPATIEYRLTDSARLFAKLYRDESGAHAYSVLRALWESDFGHSQRYQVAEPLRFVPKYNLLLMKEARGVSLSSLLTSDQEAALSGVREAARWLLKLHGSPVRIGKPDQPWYMFHKLSMRLAKAAASHPAQMKTLQALLDQLQEIEGRRREVELVQVHGQFRPIHVFLSGETVTVIDLDRSIPADPARDLAEFVHRLRSSLFQKSGSLSQVESLTRAFLDEYAAGRPSGLANFPFYQGWHILVSLCRHMKKLEADDPEWEVQIPFYFQEFDQASGNFLS